VRGSRYSRLPLDELEPVSLPDDDLPVLEPEVDDDPVLPDVPLAERPDVDPLEVPELLAEDIRAFYRPLRP